MEEKKTERKKEKKKEKEREIIGNGLEEKWCVMGRI